MSSKAFTAGKKVYTIYYTKGAVVGKEKNFETQVYGSGGGGGSYQGTGGSAPVSISSRTVIHDKIYLKEENGKERAVELTDWDIACREGHELLILWIIQEGKQRGSYAAIKNFTTEEVQYDENLIERLAGKKPWQILFLLGVGKILLLWGGLYVLSEIYRESQLIYSLYHIGSGNFWLLLCSGAAIYEIIYNNKRSKNRIAHFKRQIDSFLETFD